MNSALKTDKLFKVFDEIPIGVRASAECGTLVYSNKAGLAHASLSDGDGEVDGRIIRLEKMSLPLDGKTYQVCLSYDITEQRHLEDDLFKRAYFDALTGLPNRSVLEQSVTSLMESADAEFALAFIDLDGFKNVNDYYGHAVGDALLIKIAERLSSELRSTDVLARVGGDEFVLLMSSANSRDEVASIVHSFLERLKEPFFINGYEIFTSASIGVSLYPIHGNSFDTLCANADQAMYRIKDNTKGRIQFFNVDVGQACGERMKIEQRLRLAVRDRHLCCAYQPKVDFRSGNVTGVEVLLRWRDEDGLIQPPGDFVNLAVELGLMDEITHLVLAETIDAIDQIDAAFGPTSTISINVAARQADEQVFMRSLVDTIKATGCAERFMLELTEEAFLSKSRFQTDILPMVREIGARVSIDDFGTGYSSLSALADITADEIKVDRSFITSIHSRPRSQGILKAIESLALALKMSIVVEGVETLDELLYLQGTTRIRQAQGYFFARPMFLDELPRQKSILHGLRQTPTPARVPQLRVVMPGN